jgi:hypothetical protein
MDLKKDQFGRLVKPLIYAPQTKAGAEALMIPIVPVFTG